MLETHYSRVVTRRFGILCSLSDDSSMYSYATLCAVARLTCSLSVSHDPLVWHCWRGECWPDRTAPFFTTRVDSQDRIGRVQVYTEKVSLMCLWGGGGGPSGKCIQSKESWRVGVSTGIYFFYLYFWVQLSFVTLTKRDSWSSNGASNHKKSVSSHSYEYKCYCIYWPELRLEDKSIDEVRYNEFTVDMDL